MKSIYLKSLLLFVSLPFLYAKCDKKLTEDCLRGKVIRITCATTVVQITGRNDIGTDGWKNGMNNDAQTYDNVFSVANKCSLPADLKAGEEFTFKIEKPKPTDCVVCMMYDAPPEAKFDVTNFSKEPCK